MAPSPPRSLAPKSKRVSPPDVFPALPSRKLECIIRKPVWLVLFADVSGRRCVLKFGLSEILSQDSWPSVFLLSARVASDVRGRMRFADLWKLPSIRRLLARPNAVAQCLQRSNLHRFASLLSIYMNLFTADIIERTVSNGRVPSPFTLVDAKFGSPLGIRGDRHRRHAAARAPYETSHQSPIVQQQQQLVHESYVILMMAVELPDTHLTCVRHVPKSRAGWVTLILPR